MIVHCTHDEAVNILKNAGDLIMLTVKHYRAATPFLKKEGKYSYICSLKNRCRCCPSITRTRTTGRAGYACSKMPAFEVIPRGDESNTCSMQLNDQVFGGKYCTSNIENTMAGGAVNLLRVHCTIFELNCRTAGRNSRVRVTDEQRKKKYYKGLSIYGAMNERGRGPAFDYT